MNKSLLITMDFPPNFGGVAAYYYNVCDNLPPDKILVLAPKQGGDDDFDVHQSFPIIRSEALSKLVPRSRHLGKISARINLLRLNREILQIIKSHQIKLLQIGQVLPLGTLALFYKCRYKLPYIFYTHGLDIILPQRSARKAILLKKIIRGAQGIVANSNFTYHELVRLGADPRKIIIVNPCPDLVARHVPDELMTNFLKRHDLAGKKILFTVGRLVERKGHDMVIKALPQIIGKVPDCIYAIIGGGPYRKNLENLVNRYKMGRYVKFFGGVPAQDLPFFYQAGDVFIMPSRRLENGDVEGFGIVYLEANAFGKPVIGGRSGGVPEAVIDGQTGILVDPLNIKQVAEAAVNLLNDTAYAHRLGMQGLDRVLENFNWPAQTAKIAAILE